MPSSPERVDRPRPSARPAAPRRFERIALGEPPAAAAAPPASARWSFEASLPAASLSAAASAPVAAPEPFVVSDCVGVPPAVLAEARRAARSEGYAAGFASGVADARERSAAEATDRQARAECAEAAARQAVERAVVALRAAAVDLDGRAATTCTDLEQLVLDSAYDLAEAVLGSALRDDCVRGTSALRRAMNLVPAAGAGVTVALHPTDVATVTAHGELPEGVRLVGDPTVTPGDAVATSGDTTVEARLGDGLARAREVLGR